MEIELYQYQGNPNTINKTLTNPNVISGYMSNDLDIDSPTIKLASYELKYNYVFIPLLNRYYFIDAVRIDPNGIWHTKLTLDVLKTFADKIMTATVHVTEGESDQYEISQANTATPLKVFDTVSLTNPFTYDNKTTVLIALNTGTQKG